MRIGQTPLLYGLGINVSVAQANSLLSANTPAARFDHWNRDRTWAGTLIYSTPWVLQLTFPPTSLLSAAPSTMPCSTLQLPP
ncbi:uncharacterized protein C8Q71DRAFT_186953 [Rhodofomes roseus]|uniref:Uncharacterized protein n=1 Tax=Rhodofomes roseus TaxID=34475 RepID=A0ABQ8K8I2_9APHY|nr:uncharacterized protein C8Q71DRAFT_186953 [Rhodofomes roseus]KAH9833504.1 hypothetical protein C8Q71DRAFT_186953 [Rhodofomes roseus]